MDLSLIFVASSSVLVLLVGSSSLENDIARESVFHCEAELRLVEYIFLRLLSHKLNKQKVREERNGQNCNFD